MNLFIILLLLNKILCSVDINYDEDISLPVPEVILNHSPINTPASQYLTTIENCPCREQPGIYAVCYGITCKQFPAELHINVSLFKMKLSSIKVLRKDDLKLFTGLQFLEIESNLQLNEIQPGFFHNMINLRNLTISFNEQLKYLEEDVFEGLINLSTLCMQNNGFAKVIDITKTLSIKYVPALFLLRLDENKFPEIHADEFSPMIGSKLEQLNMILCQIEYIHPDALGPLQKLSSLRLGQNHLNSSVIANLIERSTDLGIPLDNLNLYGMGLRVKPPFDLLNAIAKSNVRFLHLIVNHFDELNDDDFPYMPNLIQISLRGNNIRDISLNTFKKMPKLESMLLTVNRLVQVPPAVLLPNLKELDLAGNTFDVYYPSYFYIPDEIFKNMTNLKYLTLAYNNICMLTKYSFVGLTNLTKLNLKNTSITLIKNGTFAPLNNLILLNLINNPFAKYIYLKADMFQGLNKLEILLLAGCYIRNLTVYPSLFTYTQNLKYLNLERNEIFQIGPQYFTSLNNLQYLNLNENKLSTWNKPILGIKSLKVFSAISNKLTIITTAMLEDWISLDVLNLDGNPFTCDCSLYSVAVWFKNHESVRHFHENNVASCVSPSNWRRKSIVTFLISLSTSETCDNYTAISLPIIICIALIFVIIIALITVSYVHRYNIKYLIFTIKLSKKQNQLDNYTYDVYVSYNSSDEWFTNKLIEILEPELKLFIIERDLQIGEIKTKATAVAISSSRRPLLIVSGKYIECTWNRWEIELVAKKSPIIVQLESVDVKNATPLLRYFLRTRIYLLWPQDNRGRNVFWQKLKTALL